MSSQKLHPHLQMRRIRWRHHCLRQILPSCSIVLCVFLVPYCSIFVQCVECRSGFHWQKDKSSFFASLGMCFLTVVLQAFVVNNEWLWSSTSTQFEQWFSCWRWECDGRERTRWYDNANPHGKVMLKSLTVDGHTTKRTKTRQINNNARLEKRLQWGGGFGIRFCCNSNRRRVKMEQSKNIQPTKKRYSS